MRGGGRGQHARGTAPPASAPRSTRRSRRPPARVVGPEPRRHGVDVALGVAGEPQTHATRLLTGTAARIRRMCIDRPPSRRPQWFAGARPRTLPAAVSPVLAGTGVAAYDDDAVWWKALLALVVALALQVGVNYANDYSDGIRGTDADRVGPLRLVGSGTAPPGAVKRGGVRWRSASRRWPGWCSPRRPRGGWCAVGAAVRRGRVVLHRRLEAVRLPRARRGDGVRLLRPGRGDRHDVRPDRGVAGARPVYAAVGIGALACAILVANNLRDIPTDREAGKRTLAVRARRRPHPALLRAAPAARPSSPSWASR